MKTRKEIEDRKNFIEKEIKEYDAIWHDALRAGNDDRASFALKARMRMEDLQSVLAWVLGEV